MKELEVMWLQQPESKYQEEVVPDVTNRAGDETVPESG